MLAATGGDIRDSAAAKNDGQPAPELISADLLTEKQKECDRLKEVIERQTRQLTILAEQMTDFKSKLDRTDSAEEISKLRNMLAVRLKREQELESTMTAYDQQIEGLYRSLELNELYRHKVTEFHRRINALEGEKAELHSRLGNALTLLAIFDEQERQRAQGPAVRSSFGSQSFETIESVDRLTKTTQIPEESDLERRADRRRNLEENAGVVKRYLAKYRSVNSEIAASERQRPPDEKQEVEAMLILWQKERKQRLQAEQRVRDLLMHGFVGLALPANVDESTGIEIPRPPVEKAKLIFRGAEVYDFSRSPTRRRKSKK